MAQAKEGDNGQPRMSYLVVLLRFDEVLLLAAVVVRAAGFT